MSAATYKMTVGTSYMIPTKMTEMIQSTSAHLIDISEDVIFELV